MSYYPTDIDFLRDDKIVFLRSQFGPGAVLAIQALWCRMYDAEGPVQRTNLRIYGVAQDCGLDLDTVQAVIDAAISVELLTYTADTNELYSKGVSERIGSFTRDKNRMRSIRSEQTRTNDEQMTNKCEQTANSVSFSFSFSELEENKKGEDPSVDENQTQSYGPGGHVRMTPGDHDRCRSFFSKKSLTDSDFERGLEILDAWLAEPKNSKRNQNHAACLVRWVYGAVVEEKTSENRLKRSETNATSFKERSLAREAASVQRTVSGQGVRALIESALSKPKVVEVKS